MKEMSIKELLEQTMVVPEIQREYVWGNSKNRLVLEKFLDELDNALKNNKESNIGFLYSYGAENTSAPKDVPHYIIDGQQRFTTVVLLLFYFAIKAGKTDEFEGLLGWDKPMMHFSYRVRPLTEHFLVNLFSKTTSIEQLKNVKDSIWYISEYDNDKTIASICSLYKYATEKKYEEIDYDSLLNRVRFYYFDVKQTSQGEELYITMNSRGEKLNDAEQIKPYILEKLGKGRRLDAAKYRQEAAKEWDTWEDFLFERLETKDLDNINKIDIALENIIKITLELYGTKKLTNSDEKWEYNEINPAIDSQRIKFNQIKKVYDVIKKLLNSEKQEIKALNLLNFLFSSKRDEKILFTTEVLVKALNIGYTIEDENIHRLIRLVRNSCAYSVMDHVPLLKFLSRLEKSDNIYEYILSHKDLVQGVFEKGNNCEEINKLEGIVNKKVSEQEIEDAEGIPIFDGKIHLLYKDSAQKISWEKFKEKLAKAKEVFEASGNKAIKETQYVAFLQCFIKSFINWGQLYNRRFFNNNLNIWKELLTDYNYLLPLENALLHKETDITSQYDKNNDTYPIYVFFINKKNIQKIIEENKEGRIYNYQNNLLVFYPPYSPTDKDIILDTNRKKQIDYLKDDLGGTINNEPIGKFYFGWDISFSYKDEEYKLTWGNELTKNDGTIISKNVKDVEALKNCLKSSRS